MIFERMVTFVIPSYNAEKTLANCINSIRSVGFFPIIVVDDGSIDNTSNIAKEFGVRVIKIANSGAYLARRVGLSLVKTPYVYFLDVDDLLLPGFLKAVEELENLHDVDCLVGSFLSIGNGFFKRQVQKKSSVSAKSLINCHYGIAPISASLWKTVAAYEAYDRDPEALGLRKGDDYELFIRVALDKDLICRDYLMVAYSVPGGKSTQNVRDSLDTTIKIARYYAEVKKIYYRPIPKYIYESIISFRQTQISYYDKRGGIFFSNVSNLPILVFRILIAKAFFIFRKLRYK